MTILFILTSVVVSTLVLLAPAVAFAVARRAAGQARGRSATGLRYHEPVAPPVGSLPDNPWGYAA